MAYFSNQCSEGELEELAMKDATIKQVLAYEKYFKDNPEERRKYEQREKAVLDYNSDIAEARAEGEARGAVKGMVQAIQFFMAGKGISFSEAMEEMHIPKEKRSEYLQYYQTNL